MRVVLVTPAPRGSTTGNRTTALRWSRILRELSHRVRVVGRWDGEPCDLLLALHARKSLASVERFHRAHPERPVVTALTGSDIYRDLARSPRTLRSLAIARRLVTLQPLAELQIPQRLRPKIRVIFQSVVPVRSGVRPSQRTFDVSVIAHLRPLKDPFRAAMAARKLPRESKVRVLQVGRALHPQMAVRARDELRRNPRYQWLGELPRWKALRLLARSRLVVISSRLEGGANVVGEAVVAGVPILASRIAGNVGLLGRSYPGYFELGHTRELTRLLVRAETEPRFLERLRSHIRRRKPLFLPAREKRAWRSLLRELQEGSMSR